MLAQIQLQLEQQFAELAAARSALGYPVYALEHGLAPDSIAALGSAASVELRRTGLIDQHWLVWTVLAAEAGYQYAGDEYWPALEAFPQEWRNNDNRHWLRRRFHRFRDRFRGPVPVGRWADHFSIISWPIANAILPRYLQAHFARHLYANRFTLANVVSTQASNLGNVLCDRYDGSSSRFADFLQQVDLTTQIVLALRDEDVGDGTRRIASTLLKRIVADLEERRESREYLRAARKVISMRRATVSVGLRGPASDRTSPGVSEAAISGPKLAARRLGAGSVLVGLIYPNIAAALERAGIAQTALGAARMAMAGPEPRLEPALGLITYSKQVRQLVAMPAPNAPVIALETDNPALRGLLEPLLSFPERKCWVLRRQSDGLFREVTGGHVRTKESYVVLVRSVLKASAAAAAGMEPCHAQVTGLCAYSLEVGERLSEESRAALATLQIGTITGTRIEPIGIAPSFPELARLPSWLVNEPVMLRIAADFNAAGFLVILDDEVPSTLTPTDGVSVVAFEALDLGPHRLSVRALTRAGDIQSGTGDVALFEFGVAVPRPWQEAMRGKAGFRVLIEPPEAGLEELLAGRATLDLFGPAGRSVQWSLETYDAAGHLATSSTGGTTRIGANASMIASVLDRLRQSESDAIDGAHRVDIVASLNELGRQALAFPHRADPLRWQFDRARQTARLIDETAHETPVTARRYSLATPLRKQVIDYGEAITGTAIEPPGALLIADYQSRRYALFASAPSTDRLRGLAELALPQCLILPEPEPQALLILLSSLGRWHGARPAGVQAIVRKTMTLARIRDELTALACGRDFLAVLAVQEAKPFGRAQSMVGGSPGFGFRMRTFPSPTDADEGKRTIADIARHYDVDHDPSRCADAYLLAFDPTSLRLGKGDAARDRAAALLANRTLMRGVHLAQAAVKSLANSPIAEVG